MITYGIPLVSSAGVNLRSILDIDLDASYPTGGYFIDKDNLGLFGIQQLNATANLHGFIYDFDVANSKLLVYEASGSGSLVVDPNTAGTPFGTVSQPTFTGDDPGGHSHGILTAVETPSKAAFRRLYTGTVGGAGTGIIVGSTIAQAISGATGTVVGIHSTASNFFIDINPFAGTFDTTNLVTATNPDTTVNTFTPVTTLIDVWPFTGIIGLFGACFDYSLARPFSTIWVDLGFSSFIAMQPGDAVMKYVVQLNQAESLSSEGFVSPYFPYIYNITDSTDPGAPTGIVSQPTFGGVPMIPHTHSTSGGGSGGITELPNGTDLSSVTGLQIVAFGQ